MYVLVTNDDGVDSEGLLKLKQAIQNVAEVAVIAPERNWSVAGHNKTIHRPLRVKKTTLPDGDWAYVTDGAPADCVALGALGLLDRRPDLVVSGINKGPNLGDDLTYSGTVAAALEAIIMGIPAIAVSEASYESWIFAHSAEFIARLIKRFLENGGIEPEVLLNVNVPSVPREELRGVEVTRLGKRVYRDSLLGRQDDAGNPFYVVTGPTPIGLLEDGTDYKAVTENRISITPIHLDLTNHEMAAKMKNWNLWEKLLDD